MGGVLRAEPVWVETLTGLQIRQFEGLVRAVRERGGNGPGGGGGGGGGRARPRRLVGGGWTPQPNRTRP
ncbi:hypothetical protein ACFVZ3_37535, partial [Kitasatospora purpeofusca]